MGQNLDSMGHAVLFPQVRDVSEGDLHRWDTHRRVPHSVLTCANDPRVPVTCDGY